MGYRDFALFVFCLMNVPAVLAHGPQLQITNVSGKIVTHEVLTDVYTPLTEPRSVYVMPVLEYRGAWYARPETEVHPPGHLLEGQPVYYSGPGLAYGVGQTFDTGVVLSLQFVEDLKLWNGSVFLDPGAPQVQAFRGGSIGSSGELINPTASAFSVNSFLQLDFAPIDANYDDQAHGTVRFRFLGDGSAPVLGTGTTATEPADGVYLATLVVHSTQSDLAPTDPFYFVMHKNAAWSDVRAAVQSLGVPRDGVQYLGIPEPSSFAIAGLALAAVGVWSRHRGRT